MCIRDRQRSPWTPQLYVRAVAGAALPGFLWGGGDRLPQGSLRLADLLVAAGDETGALEEFLQACHHGDPGANGCAHAAEIVAARGDLETAIRYYRLSNWSETRARVEELERQLAGE